MSIPKPTQNCHFASSEGRKCHQEDRVTWHNGLEEVKVGAVAVFDGHFGSIASEMASHIFLYKFMRKLNNSIEQSSNLKELLKSSLVTTIIDIDAEFSEARTQLLLIFLLCDFNFLLFNDLHYSKRHRYTGSTAVVALIYNNHVLVANVGDSKAFLCSQKKISQEAGEGAASLAGLRAEELTRDHNVHRLDERARIEASEGVLKFYHDFVPLLMSHFPMTRAIGDVMWKRYGVIANPEMTDWRSLTSKDEFLVVASDGIFESLAPQKVCDFLNEVEDHSDPSLLAQQLIQKAYLEGSSDNLSVVLVPLGSGDLL
ncbi:hypothetical protein RND71_037702 [Anisodus tanguticus]|uniref:PPM-type phosphatase domain-containing protein n=1 Tax=Anisodus tanguticus TaxID=243964 RepID=A0AAE1QYL8_9SOLA|nr:hypothetical protein RND71_037702 [Anisodus tanguticus]